MTFLRFVLRSLGSLLLVWGAVQPLAAASTLDSALSSTLSSALSQDYLHANNLCREARWNEALKLYEHIIHARPQFSPAHNDAGVCLARLGRLTESVEAHKRALAADSTNSEAWYNLGWTLNALRHHAEAMKAYHRALRLNPHDTAALGNLGWTHLEMGNAAEAERVYRAVIALCPHSGYAHKGLGKALEGQSRTSEAIAAYERAVQLDPTQIEAHTRLAELFIKRDAPTKAFVHCSALLSLEKSTGRRLLQTLFHTIAERPVVSGFVPIYARCVREFAPAEWAFVAVQRLAERALYSHDWGAAASVFAAHKTRFPASGERFDKLIALLQTPDSTALAARFDAVSTDDVEAVPSLALDEETLYFNRELQTIATRTRRGAASYALFAMHLDSTERSLQQQMTTAKSNVFPQAVTIASGEAVSSRHSSSDGKWQYSTIELLRMVRGSLEQAQKLAFAPLEDVHDARMTSDGNAILFVARKPLAGVVSGMASGVAAGVADTDIYVSVLEGMSWSKPISLGSSINTGLNEYAPFLHPDGKTLYFSSEGHYSLGRADVFVARRLDSSWTRWSQPVNAGKTINSPAKDADFVVTTTGSNAYFARTGDIFTAAMPPKLRPEPVALVHGRVEVEAEETMNRRSPEKQGIQTHSGNAPLMLRWVNTSTGATVARVRTNAEGRYAAVLPLGSQFACYAEPVLPTPQTKKASQPSLLGYVATESATPHSIKLRRDFVLAAKTSIDAVSGYPSRPRSLHK